MPNSPRTVALRRMANERARLAAMRRNDPNGRIAGARRRANQAAAARRVNAARIIQARVRGMLARARMANPHTNIGRRAITAMFTRSPNRRATGARIRAGIRYGPEHYVSGRLRPRWSNSVSRCHGSLCLIERMRMPRGYTTRTRSPPRRRSPGRNNDNNLYA